MFFNSETKQRHNFIDASLANTAELLANPVVNEVIGAHDAELNAAMIKWSLFVPNIRHGLIVPPRRINPEAVPVVAVAVGESLHVDHRLLGLTATQKRIIARKATPWFGSAEKAGGFAERVDSGLQSHAAMQVGLKPSLSAMVISALDKWAIQGNIGKNKDRMFVGRPLMAINYKREFTRMGPAVVVHELKHVEQALFEPVLRQDSPADAVSDRLRSELEAYYAETVFMEALADIEYRPAETETTSYEIGEDGRFMSGAAGITNMIFETNAGRKDKFFPNGTLRKILEEKGLDSIYR